MLRPLLSRHFQLFLIEHRGHGRTNNPANTLDYSVVASDIAEFIDQLNLGAVHLAGFSDGATIGFFLGMTRPNLMKSLVAVGANAYVDDQLRRELALFDPGMLERDVPEFAKMFAERHDPWHYPGYWKHLVNLVRENLEQNLTLTAEDLLRIPTPTLLISGESDLMVSLEHARFMRHSIPNSELLIVNHAGADGMDTHRVHHVRPEIVGPAMIEFIQRNC